MTTEVVLTGTGVPHPRPGCAGAGTLVRHGDVALQFDAGRSTVMRLMEAGTPPHALTAVFLTHLIPPPEAPGDAEAFAQDLREGGFAGRVTVGEDLTTITL